MRGEGEGKDAGRSGEAVRHFTNFGLRARNEHIGAAGRKE